ncbi:MAG: AsmA-like C-terminal domain-containing protein, partial [Deltaproteobacteria bacterium]|nr:AsmA-like C-terminal domain-containing protein [Deltaproteobacteria bacterium]
NLLMRGPDLDAVASGEEDLVERRHNLKVFIQQHGAISSLLSKIPIIGHILIGDEKKSILTAGYHITGTWKNPETKYVPVESISNGLVGTLKRLLLTPVKILKDLQDVSKNLLKEPPPDPENNLEKQ